MNKHIQSLEMEINEGVLINISDNGQIRLQVILSAHSLLGNKSYCGFGSASDGGGVGQPRSVSFLKTISISISLFYKLSLH